VGDQAIEGLVGVAEGCEGGQGSEPFGAFTTGAGEIVLANTIRIFPSVGYGKLNGKGFKSRAKNGKIRHWIKHGDCCQSISTPEK